VIRYLLDTNICIYLLKGQFNIDKKIEEVGLEFCYISEITIAELKYGIEKSDKKEKNREVINKLISRFTLLPIYTAFDVYAREKARLKTKGQILDDFDLLIGSTAIANQMVLVTRNISDFDRLNDIHIEDWTAQ